jgi:hypothetical protein
MAELTDEQAFGPEPVQGMNDLQAFGPEPVQGQYSLDDIMRPAKQAQPQQAAGQYSLDEIMRPAQAQPKDEGMLSAAWKGFKHALVPAITGAAAFPAGAILGTEIGATVGGPFAWATGPLGGLIGGGITAYSAARATQPVSEYALDKLDLGDDVASQAASREQHPWAYGAGELAAQAPVLGPSLTAKLGERMLGAAVSGVTEARSRRHEPSRKPGQGTQPRLAMTVPIMTRVFGGEDGRADPQEGPCCGFYTARKISTWRWFMRRCISVVSS